MIVFDDYSNNAEDKSTKSAKRLRRAGRQVQQVEEDADTLIVNTAFNVCKDYDSVIVAEDIDLLVFLESLAPNNSKVYLQKPSRGKSEHKLYSSESVKYPNLKKYITVLYAFCGFSLFLRSSDKERGKK